MRKSLLIILMLFVIGFSTVALASDDLTIVSWPGYHSPELVKSFEAEYDVTVNYLEVDTFEKMFEVINDPANSVDLLVFSELVIPSLVSQDKLMPLNKSLVPNMENADPLFLNLPYDPDNKYTLPYHYLFVGLAYNKDNISESEATLQNYFEPSAKLKGRITTFPDPRFTIGYAMKYMGRSLNSLDQSDLDLSKQLLQNLKNYSTPDSGDLNRGIYDGLRAINEGKADLTIYYYENPELIPYIVDDLNVKLGFKLPTEGAIIGTDAMAILKDSDGVETAHQFINFMYDPENAAESITYLGYSFPVNGVNEKLEPALAHRLTVSTEVLQACEFLEPMNEEQTEVYLNIWNEVFSN